MIVLDTTVLVYAKGADHPLRDPCRALIEAVAAGEIAATASVEAIQEFVHVRARRRPREDAAKLGADYAELLSPLLNVTIEHLRRGLELFERLPPQAWQGCSPVRLRSSPPASIPVNQALGAAGGWWPGS